MTQGDWLAQPKEPLPENLSLKGPTASPPPAPKRAPLHQSDIRAIREENARGLLSQHELARKYEVTQATISMIVRGKLHGDVV